MKKKIEIKLKSDLCAGSGKSLGSLIDTDICYDDYGLVYIPSKRIKGLLREAFTEYYDWAKTPENDEELKKIRDNLFGVEQNNNTCNLKIDNAYLENIEKVKNDIDNVQERYKKYLVRQRVANANTYVRYQTAIDTETEVAKYNSLRATRVVEMGTVFYANVEFKTEKELEIIEKCLKLITHIGTIRTRGYGEVVCKLCDAEENIQEELSYNFIDDCNYKISLLLRADSNIMVSKQNSEISKDFIPGSNIMGAIASKYIDDKGIIDFNNLSQEYKDLFLNGEVRYSNAYITEKNGSIEYFPAPLSYSKVKNESNKYHNKMYDVNEIDIQLSNLNNQYVSLDGNNYIKNVKQSENSHHQRAKDLRMGHVSKGTDGGSFYQFTSIDMEQYFLANIETKGRDAKKIIKYLRNGDTLRVGKSKTAEYGKLIIKDVKINEVKGNVKEYKKFAAVLTSPVILFDKKNVKIANSKQQLVNSLKELFNSDLIKVTKSFIGYGMESGYNAIWNLPKEQLVSYEKGSTICFESSEGINLKEEYTIGLRQNEGYGKIKIFNIINEGSSRLELKEYKTNNNQEIEYKDLQTVTKEILNKSIKNVIIEEIEEDAFNKLKDVKINISNAAINRVLLMLKESDTLDEFMRNVEGIKDLKKLKKILEIIKEKNNLYELSAYKDYENVCNGKVSEFDNTSFALEYTKQLFTILRIKGGEK